MKMSLSVKALCHGHTFLRLTSSVAQREVYHSSAVVMKEGGFLLTKKTSVSLWGGEYLPHIQLLYFPRAFANQIEL